MTAKYGLPYFQNFINSDLQPNMVRSMCCRLLDHIRARLHEFEEQTGQRNCSASTPAARCYTCICRSA
jgi:anaerobic ribonucleoside-triphosphate reductase